MRWGAVVVGMFSLMCSSVRLDVPLYDQTVDYQTACESVATVACLNYLGYDITIDEFLDTYLDIVSPWDPVVYEEGNVFDRYFLGDPRTKNGFLCNPPVIMEAVEQYFADIGETQRRPYDLTGTGFNFLLDEVAAGHPVVIWVTGKYQSTTLKDWKGNPFYTHSHTVTLSGFDRHRGVVFIKDSSLGAIELEYSFAKSIYDMVGKRSLVIK